MDDVKQTVRALLAEGKGGVLEWVARDHGLSTLEVLRLLPAEMHTICDEVDVASVLKDLQDWGDVLIIIQSRGLVAEIVSPFPDYTIARGHYNFKGPTAFSGHLAVDAIQTVACVERPFSGRRSLSVVFFDAEGESIFKVFVRRDAKRELMNEQVDKFEILRSRLSGAV